MSKTKNIESKLSFETAVAELERIVLEMEGGKLTLEESLSAYRRGVSLLKGCQEQLTDAEIQLRQLDGTALTAIDLPNERS